MLQKIKENIILSITGFLTVALLSGILTFVVKLYNRTNDVPDIRRQLGRHDELFNDIIPKVGYLEIQHKIDSALKANN